MNLSEMLIFLGDDFRQLTYHSHKTSEPTSRYWQVKAGKRRLGHWMLVDGKTPEEALEKTIRKLHEKEAALGLE